MAVLSWWSDLFWLIPITNEPLSCYIVGFALCKSKFFLEGATRRFTVGPVGRVAPVAPKSLNPWFLQNPGIPKKAFLANKIKNLACLSGHKKFRGLCKKKISGFGPKMRPRHQNQISPNFFSFWGNSPCPFYLFFGQKSKIWLCYLVTKSSEHSPKKKKSGFRAKMSILEHFLVFQKLVVN